MNRTEIDEALRDLGREKDPSLAMAKLASLCGRILRERGIEVVVVGGSAIELLTEGAYVSGDLDICSLNLSSVPLRQRQEIMGLLGAEGGPRSWRIGGLFLDWLGEVEKVSESPFRELSGPYGPIKVMPPEELLVERVLVSVYPQAYAPARDCARKLAAVALGGALGINWNEVWRLANRPEYRILSECQSLVSEVADELGTKSPADTDRQAD